MKRKVSFFIALMILAQSLSWHYEDIKIIKTFAADAIEHLSEGDSFVVFLQKHYGDKEIVNRHLEKKHPDRKRTDNHGHQLENIIILLSHSPQKRDLVLFNHNKETHFLYEDRKSNAHIKPLYSPPELI